MGENRVVLTDEYDYVFLFPCAGLLKMNENHAVLTDEYDYVFFSRVLGS